MKTHLTESQRIFIKEHRLKMSMTDMAQSIGLSYSRIRKYMIENDLTVDRDQVFKIRRQKMYGASDPAKVKEVRNRVPKRTLSKKLDPLDLDEEEYQQPKHVADPWNHNLNPITMI